MLLAVLVDVKTSHVKVPMWMGYLSITSKLQHLNFVLVAKIEKN